MKGLTVQTVRQMVKDKSLIKLAETVFTAIAYEQTIAELVKPKRQEVIDFFKFKVAQEWIDRGIGGDFVKSYDDLYLASDDDMKLFMAEMEKFGEEQGLKVRAKGNCPLLEAESMVRDAKKYFVDALESYTGMSGIDLICSKNGLKNYRKYVDLNLSLFSGKVKKGLNKAA